MLLLRSVPKFEVVLKRYNYNQLVVGGCKCSFSFSALWESGRSLGSNGASAVSKDTLAQKIVKKAPICLQPYLQLMRLDRPIGSWLLFWPCAWSLSLASPAGLPDPKLLGLFGVGAVVMRGAGCTINDLWDKDFDGKEMPSTGGSQTAVLAGIFSSVLVALYIYRHPTEPVVVHSIRKVARTASRPLADGSLSVLDALALLAIQLGVGCQILLQLNWYSVLLGFSSLGLVVLYPLMKRFTYWPQLVLGVTFNWGALLGWAAVNGSLHWLACLPLYAAGVAWTLIYDTIYAHQDKLDDAFLGIKSTALKFGEKTTRWLWAFSSVMMSSLVVTGINEELAWPYYLALLAVGCHLSSQILTLNISDAGDCGRKFRSNRHIGLLLFLGIVMGKYMKNYYSAS